jgi:hypothetical protein
MRLERPHGLEERLYARLLRTELSRVLATQTDSVGRA